MAARSRRSRPRRLQGRSVPTARRSSPGLSFRLGPNPRSTTGIITEGGITAQTHQVLQNLGAVLKAAGISFDRVVKTTVYPLGYGQLSGGNEIYGTYFPTQPPARARFRPRRFHATCWSKSTWWRLSAS